VKLALQQPEFGMEVDYSKVFEIELPNRAAVDNLTRWLSVSTLSALHNRDREAALDSITTLAKLAACPLNRQLMRAQVARARLCEMGLQVTWEALQDDGWTDNQLLQMQQAWQSTDLISDLPKVVEVQRAIDLLAWEKVTHWPSFIEITGSQRISWGSIIWGVWKVMWKSQDESRFLQMWELKSEFLRNVTASTAAYVPYQKLWDLKYGGNGNLYYNLPHLYSQMFFGYMTCDVPTIIRCETRRHMTLAAIALQRYQNSTGHPPSDLNALVPSYLSVLPHDYMDGKTLKYRVNPGGTWTLYSVGEDGVDNGGSLERSNLYVSKMWDTRDAVWPQAAVKAPTER
jgi:hypothetical protein